MKLTGLERCLPGRSNGIDEESVQDFIASNPSMLGLGVSTKVREKQRRHQGAGILDLLLESDDGKTRYVVELMLGDLDESHIIRAIEYWDIERRAYPGIAHVAVLVAEVLGRFLSVIGLLSGAGRIPLMVIQMSAFKSGPDQVALAFSKVLDQQRAIVEDEGDEEDGGRGKGPAWEARVPKASIDAVNAIFEKLKHGADQMLELREKKHYIAVSQPGGRQTDFVFYPQARLVQMAIRADQSQAMDEKLAEIGEYDSVSRWYKLKILPTKVEENAEVFHWLGKTLFVAQQSNEE